MNDPRIDPVDTGELAGLPPGDPRREALASRPGARARLRAYEEFIAPGPPADAADAEDAEERLRLALARELGIPPEAVDAGGAPPAASGPTARGARERANPFVRGTWSVLAAAAAVAIVAGAWMLAARREAVQGRQLRGAPAPAAPGAWDARPTAGPGADGATVLRWNTASGADRYAVVFLGADLAEIARRDDVREPRLAIANHDAVPGLVPGAHVLWRVVAYRGGDEIGRSGTAPLTVP